MALDSTNALCTVAELRSFVGLSTVTTSAVTTQLEEYINGASWTLKQETKRVLVSQVLTEYYDGDGTDTVILREYPCTSVTTLHTDSEREFGSDHLVSADDYENISQQGIIKITGTALDVGVQVIKVVYDAGYTTVPYDLKMACIELAAFWYEKFKSHRIGLQSVSNTAGTNSYVEDMPGLVKQTIERYRRK